MNDKLALGKMALMERHKKPHNEIDENSPVFNIKEVDFFWAGMAEADVPRKSTQMNLLVVGGFVKNNENLCRLIGRMKFKGEMAKMILKGNTTIELLDFEFERKKTEKECEKEFIEHFDVFLKDLMVIPRFRIVRSNLVSIPKKSRGKNIKEFLKEYAEFTI